MKPMGGRTWKYWPASGPVFFEASLPTSNKYVCVKVTTYKKVQNLNKEACKRQLLLTTLRRSIKVIKYTVVQILKETNNRRGQRLMALPVGSAVGGHYTGCD